MITVRAIGHRVETGLPRRVQGDSAARAPQLHVFLAFAMVIFTPLLAQDYGNKKPPTEPAVSIPLTAEQKTALDAIDIRIGGVESLAAKIDDEKFKASTAATIADLKRRRATLAKKFDQMTYEALMHLVIGRYQVVALWLTPPRVPEPAKK
jgi:hypothetical protein